MRIVKYIFLLLLLAIVGITVYIATQKGDFEIERSTVIKVPKEIVFNYVNDYRNWENWNAWKEDDSSMEFIYPDNTVGQGGSYSWKASDSEGEVKTIFVKQNDSISQKTTSGSNQFTSNITFKDTVGGTKVIWRSSGSVDFMSKVYATFNGGINKMMTIMHERSLNNLNHIITKEINTFNVEVNGIVQKPATFYIKQTATTKLKDMQSGLNSMLQKMIAFFKNNSMSMNGKPFVIYESIDTQAGTITFTVGGPLREEIFLAPGSDIGVGKLEAFSALKTTLIGDYSHRDEAIKKAKDHIYKNNINQNTALKYMDVYLKNASDVKSPSKWVTEILIPVQAEVVPVATPTVVTPPIIDTQVITD